MPKVRKIDRIDMPYREYIRSELWEQRKAWYYRQRPKECWVCGITKGIHLHHASYDRLGKERLSDLVPLCDKHHNEFHTTYPSFDNIKRKSKRYVRWASDRDLPKGIRRTGNGKYNARELPSKKSREGKRERFIGNYRTLDEALRAQEKVDNRNNRPESTSVVASTDGPPCRRCDTPMLMMKHGPDWIKPTDKGHYAFWWLCKNDGCKTTLVMPKEGYVRKPR